MAGCSQGLSELRFRLCLWCLISPLPDLLMIAGTPLLLLTARTAKPLMACADRLLLSVMPPMCRLRQGHRSILNSFVSRSSSCAPLHLPQVEPTSVLETDPRDPRELDLSV